MTHNDQCECTECVATRQQQPPAPPRYEGSGGVAVEIREVENPALRRLIELPAQVAGATIVGAAELEGEGRTVALLARAHGKTIAIWFDRDTGSLVAREAAGVV